LVKWLCCRQIIKESWFQFAAAARDYSLLLIISVGSAAHPASYSRDTMASLPWGKAAMVLS